MTTMKREAIARGTMMKNRSPNSQNREAISSLMTMDLEVISEATTHLNMIATATHISKIKVQVRVAHTTKRPILAINITKATSTKIIIALLIPSRSNTMATTKGIEEASQSSSSSSMTLIRMITKSATRAKRATITLQLIKDTRTREAAKTTISNTPHRTSSDDDAHS